MGRIRVLPERVANQIAAGEVVERPASVVKELVENALDAGATRVAVAIEGGGAERIRVDDDGQGMDREDAALAVERHATSKIREAGDLEGIASFGFRGEALPSIASVSRFVLTTSAGGAEGTRLRVTGGKASVPEPAAHPRGTTVEVEGLFHNAPARRKFLRSPAAETARIAEIVVTIAAAHPTVAFGLESGGRPLARLPAAATRRERVTQILGSDEAAQMHLLDEAAGALRLSGLVSAPALQRATSRDVRLYVNARPVRDRRVLHAVQAAYATLLPAGRFPVAWLFLEAPAGEVDVNVHPAKSEVRFRRPAAVHELVRGAVRRTLAAARPVAGVAPAFDAVGVAAPRAATSFAETERVATRVAETAPGWSGGGPAAALFDTLPLAPLAQFRETYILAAAPDGLVILDQHAAHERVLYERILGEVGAGRVARQRLLFPLVLEASPAQVQALEAAGDLLERLGFGVSAFGSDAVKVEEAPLFAPTAALDRLVRGILEELLEWERAEGVDGLRHRLAASAACHSAVTARQALGEPEMRAILAALAGSRSPMTCPHGRPALLRLPLEAIEKQFRRR